MRSITVYVFVFMCVYEHVYARVNAHAHAHTCSRMHISVSVCYYNAYDYHILVYLHYVSIHALEIMVSTHIK